MAICSDDRFCDLDREVESLGDQLPSCVDDADVKLGNEHGDGSFTLSINLGSNLEIEPSTTLRGEAVRLPIAMLAQVKGGVA